MTCRRCRKRNADHNGNVCRVCHFLEWRKRIRAGQPSAVDDLAALI